MASDTPVQTETPEQAKKPDKHNNGLWHWTKVRVKDFVFRFWLPRRYQRCIKAPVVPNRVLFVELSRSEISNNLQRMWDCMRDEYGMDCRFVSLGSFRQSMPIYFRNCNALMGQLAEARYVFICESIEAISCVDLRSETVVANLWHGPGAFKRFGMSTADKIFGGDRAEKLRFPQNRNNALVSVSSPEVVWAYVEALGLEETPEVVQALGTSRTDVFFDEEFLAQAKSTLRTVLPSGDTRKVVLYAPTFRGRVSFASPPDALDLSAMQQALGHDFVVLIKHHPHIATPPPVPKVCANFAFDVTHTLPIDVLLAGADVCVTDYSSLVFEYSLFDRPMAFFAYDLDDFDDWRGFYYPYEDFVPGPIVKTTAELIAFLQHLDEQFDPAQVKEFRTKFMEACDGHATARIAKAVVEDGLMLQAEADNSI